MSSHIESAVIMKNSHGYELTDSDGETIGFTLNGSRSQICFAGKNRELRAFCIRGVLGGRPLAIDY